MAKWIIVVDDDISNLKMAGHILNQHQMRVTCIKSGPALLKYIGEGNRPDMILLDIKMPGMDGFETLDHLREMEKEKGIDEIPVIFLTAEEGAEAETRGFEMGVSDYIRKPFNPEVLLRRINNIVSKQDAMLNLKSEASIDKLTGFLNKAATGTELSRMCGAATGSLCMVDLDSFKLVNDIYGHEMGDKILIAFADCVRKLGPEGSKYGRIGGDEFVVFLNEMNQAEELTTFTRELNDIFLAEAKRLMGEDMDIPLGCSVGAVFVPTHGNVYDVLLKCADKSLYEVKKNGKHGCQIYHAGDFVDDALSTQKLGIDGITEILGERSIPDVALQLDKDAFSYVYRYVMRYNVRNGHGAGKILFTLEETNLVDKEDFLDICDEFGNHIRESLRKSDIFMRARYNQYFVYLTEVREDSLEMVSRHLLEKWNATQKIKLPISVEMKYAPFDRRYAGGEHHES